MTQFRQGDVYLRTEKVPMNVTLLAPDERGRTVLAYGEVTGHAHVMDGDVELFELANEVDRWLRVRSTTATLVHDEHGPITLDRGEYRVRIQREYTPESIRQVAD